MTERRRALLVWLAIGAGGFLALPWYMLQDSVWSLQWLLHFASKEAAPAWLQAALFGRAWLVVPGVLLLACAVTLSPGLARTTRADLSIALGACGFLYGFAQGFAIGPNGW